MQSEADGTWQIHAVEQSEHLFRIVDEINISNNQEHLNNRIREVVCHHPESCFFLLGSDASEAVSAYAIFSQDVESGLIFLLFMGVLHSKQGNGIGFKLLEKLMRANPSMRGIKCSCRPKTLGFYQKFAGRGNYLFWRSVEPVGNYPPPISDDKYRVEIVHRGLWKIKPVKLEMKFWPLWNYERGPDENGMYEK